MLAVFSLSFAMNDNYNADDDTKEAVDKTRIKIPTHG